MERYTLGNTTTLKKTISIKQGKYYKKVNEKHKDSFGELGANNIRDNIMFTYSDAIQQIEDKSMNNNILLVGKVQSGKTANLELFTALAFDNGFNLVVIYGGYDNTLLKQTTTRFKKTFDIPNDTEYSNDTPVIFSSDDSNKLLTVDDEIIEDLLEANKPIFLISMKRPNAMNKVNSLLNRIDKRNLRAFIIDDEGDQASLNTRKNKEKDASATYAAIVDMKEHLNDPMYLSVTATPQALIFLDEYSRLRPDSIRLIEPGKGYCGAEAYHLFDSKNIEIIDDDDQQSLSEGVIPDSLRDAIQHFIVASAIMYKIGYKKSDMIIHSHRNVSNHDTIYRMVDAYIQALKLQTDYNDKNGLSVTKKELCSTYNRFFTIDVRKQYAFEDLWNTICGSIIKRIYLILKNSTGQVTQANEGLRKYKIYIGGDLLQRGVTFSNLVTTYFSRWAKDGGNMDTNLQRARWFGYREKYIDICKIFTSSTISREFTTLSEIETDLWEQFNAIQTRDMNIDDILIHADSTKQKPTRKNVASYSIVSFKNKWIKQRTGVFDKIQVAKNNALVEELLKCHSFSVTTVGRKDKSQSATYAIIEQGVLSKLISCIQVVFDMEPFERRALTDLIMSSDNIPVILMNDNDGNGRKRSFYQNNKIFALQQGADNKDPDKAVYNGDSHVIIDKDKINVQIHRIVPKKKNIEGHEQIMEEFTQYMFAIYVPKEKKYYVKV